MAVGPATLRAMFEAGLEQDTILAIVEAMASEAAPVERTPSKGALRTRRWRENIASQPSQNVTSDDGDAESASSPEQNVPTPLKTQTPSPKENPPKGGQKKGWPEEFDRFRAAYPIRRGANPGTPARKSFDRAIALGADPDEIIAAAGRYADEQTRIGNAPGPFVKTMVAWLNQRCWEDYPAGFRVPDPPRLVKPVAPNSNQAILDVLARSNQPMPHPAAAGGGPVETLGPGDYRRTG